MDLHDVFGNPDELRDKIERLSDDIRQAVLGQYPQSLIGYLWASLLSSLMRRDDGGEVLPPVGVDEQDIVFALEYVHAVLSCFSTAPTEFAEVNEAEADRLIKLCGELRAECMHLTIVGLPGQQPPLTQLGERTAHAIYSSWINIRGHRFQVLEDEFFKFVLRPHDAILNEIYGIGSDAVAEGIQRMADSMRSGFSKAMQRFHDFAETQWGGAEGRGLPLEEYIRRINESDESTKQQFSVIWNDLFHGGICRVTDTTGLPSLLLDDLSYSPGENTEFYANGDYIGTPFRTLPGRIKPLIRLSDGHYFVDPSFARDSSYRAIQRSIISRKPEYREEWNRRQKELSESSLPNIFSDIISSDDVYGEVYYPLPDGNWAECDCVIITDDVLISVEAKAGVTVLQSPAENLGAHSRAIENLILKGFRQSKRFIEYLCSAAQVQLYRKDANGYAPFRAVSASKLRKIFPLSLTVETFSPFSAMAKEMPEVVPICDKHNFVSLSIDDLFVMRWVLRSTGELLHYLDVRQALAGMPEVMLYDEVDHLGGYVSQNRIDEFARGAIERDRVNMIWFDRLDQDVIAPFFASPDWPNGERPRQRYPSSVQELLDRLDSARSEGWAELDTFLRNLSTEGRAQFAENLEIARRKLSVEPYTWALLGDSPAIMVCAYRPGLPRWRDRTEMQAEVVCLAANLPAVLVMAISISEDGRYLSADRLRVRAPSLLRVDLPELRVAAARVAERLSNARRNVRREQRRGRRGLRGVR